MTAASQPIADARAPSAPTRRPRTGASRGLRGYYWLMLALLYLPIVLLFVFSFNANTILSFPLKGFTLPVLGIVLLNLALLVSPLLFFGPQLLAVKRRGLREYGRLATGYVRRFDAKWLRSAAPRETLLGSADVQSLADMAGAFDVIREMRVVPIERHQILLLAAAAAVPTLPLIFFVTPLEDLIEQAVRTVLHL